MVSSRKQLSHVCKYGELMNVIKLVESRKPIDFRDVLSAIDICIDSYMHSKFLYLFNHYMQPSDMQPHICSSKIIAKIQFRAFCVGNNFVKRVISNFNEKSK